MLVTALPCIVLVLCGGPAIRLWAGPHIVPTQPLLVGFAVWTLLAASTNATHFFLNARTSFAFK